MLFVALWPVDIGVLCPDSLCRQRSVKCNANKEEQAPLPQRRQSKVAEKHKKRAPIIEFLGPEPSILKSRGCRLQSQIPTLNFLGLQPSTFHPQFGSCRPQNFQTLRLQLSVLKLSCLQSPILKIGRAVGQFSNFKCCGLLSSNWAAAETLRAAIFNPLNTDHHKMWKGQTKMKSRRVEGRSSRPCLFKETAEATGKLHPLANFELVFPLRRPQPRRLSGFKAWQPRVCQGRALSACEIARAARRIVVLQIFGSSFSRFGGQSPGGFWALKPDKLTRRPGGRQDVKLGSQAR